MVMTTSSGRQLYPSFVWPVNDYALSIEHEDSLMSGREGLQKAIAFLKNVLIYEDRGTMFWA